MSARNDPKEDDERLLRIETKIDLLQQNLNKFMLDFQKQIAELDKRLTLIEDEDKRQKQSRWNKRDIIYLGTLIATWATVIIMILK